MKCKQVRDLIGPYLYGDLDADEMRAVRVHAQQCSDCREDIRTQGAVASSLKTSAPELTEEERQRIAWSVKGAIKAESADAAERGWFFSLRPAPAYILAAAVLAGLFVIKVTGFHSSGGGPADKSRAIVKVTEERGATPAKKPSVASQPNREAARMAPNDQTAQRSSSSASDDRRHKRSIDVVGALNYMRQGTGPAVTARKGHKIHPGPVVPEAPAPVVSNTQTSDVKVDNSATKLPKPTGLNDAQAAPSPKERTDANAQPAAAND